MKKLLMVLFMLCAFCASQSAYAKTKKADDGAGKEKTLKGCLHKDGDNMWLKTHMGKYHVMSKDDISAHDGHEVKLTGTVSNGPLPGDTTGKQVKHIEVSKLDMVSEKCSMGEKKMKMSGNEMDKDKDDAPKK